MVRDWPYHNEEIGKLKNDQLFESNAPLDRVTYEAFAIACSSKTSEEGFADRMNNFPKFVFSKNIKKMNGKILL